MPFCNWILDILLIAFLAFGFYYGWKRGFLRIVLKTFASLFAAVIAMSAFDKVGAFLRDTFVYTFVHNKIMNKVEDLGIASAADDIVEAVPETFQKAADLVGIDLASMAESAMQSGEDAVARFAESASFSIAQFISSAAAFVLLFLVSFFVLRFLSTPINAIVMRLPILGRVNHLLGLVFGAFTSMIIAWIVIKFLGFLDTTFALSFIEVEDAWASGAFYRYSLLS